MATRPTAHPRTSPRRTVPYFPVKPSSRDGWLRHDSGGNNHCVLLTECWYGPLLECRNLEVATDATGACTANVAARNVGSLDGSIPAMLRVDGKAEATQQITLHHDAEATVRWKVAIPTGVHTVAVDDLSATLRR